jgi:hypothetical protein
MPEQPAGERRSVARTPCAPDAVARVSGSFAGSPRWGRLLDASADGLGLLLPAPFEAGRMLVLGLHLPGRPHPHAAVARVAHASAWPDGRFRVGCALDAPLPAEVLAMLTSGAGGPTA